MRTLMIAALLCGTLTLPSNADEPASLQPIYDALDAAAYRAEADPVASLAPLYQACSECSCGEGKCDCVDCDQCPCAGKVKEVVRTILKPPTMKLSAEARARMERPADAARQATKAATEPPRGTQWIIATLPILSKSDGTAEIESGMVPLGWKFGNETDDQLRLIDMSTSAAARVDKFAEIKTLPTYLLIKDGREVERVTKFPGTKYLGERYNAVATRREVEQSSTRGYPIRSGYWNHPGSDGDHLLTGQHAGKWPRWWIEGLSHAERESLHADDHEGRVKWEYVPKEAKPTATASRREPMYERRTVCDGKGCRTVNVFVGYRDSD